MAEPRLAMFLRFPTPGKAKTRLIPALGTEGAAQLYRKLAERALEAARDSGLVIDLRVTGAPPADFRAWLGDGFDVIEQGEGDLGARMARVPAPALLVGSDVPALTGELIAEAARKLRHNRVVIGPARDGGYYLIGLSEPMPFLFSCMPWSTNRVLGETMRRLAEHGIAPALLPELADIDEPGDLAALPDLGR
jgi:rSAM/selenodomain-associated transferase 1